MNSTIEKDFTEKLDLQESTIDRENVNQLKIQANEAFKNNDFCRAIELYSKAIDVRPDAVLYSNRSLAYLRRECYGYALIDAQKALDCDLTYIKAFYRRASAYMALGKYELALQDYEHVLNIYPDNKDAKPKYEECKKAIACLDLEQSIAADEHTKSILNQIDLNSMIVEQDYDGPHLAANDRVTVEFMTALLPYLENQKVLHIKYAYKIVLQILSLLKSSSTLVDISVPAKKKFTICGDIHGQYYDLLNIFKLNGLPSEENPYLFNGDFVDRGSFSVECILVLFGFKLLYPNHIYLARGNHETIVMNQMYGFEGEVRAKYTTHMFTLFTETFNYLPLAHRINQKILVMHGGLFGRDDITLNDIGSIDRVRQPAETGLMTELLWSDPQTSNGRSRSKRGLGIQFGPDVTERFLKLNNLDYIIRSHEVKQQGFDLAHNKKCITVFSAPNYCDITGNKGAFITITGDDLTPKFISYAAVPHPAVRSMAYANNPWGFLGFA